MAISLYEITFVTSLCRDESVHYFISVVDKGDFVMACSGNMNDLKASLQ